MLKAIEGLSVWRTRMAIQAAREPDPILRHHGVRLIFSKAMPSEQAKHATRRFLRERAQ